MNDENVFDTDDDRGTFKTIVAIADSIVLGIIPVLLLISYNTRIHSCIKSVKRDIKNIKDIQERESTKTLLDGKDNEIRKNEIKIRKDEIRMAFSFITIVAAFLCCYSVKLLFSLIFS